MKNLFCFSVSTISHISTRHKRATMFFWHGGPLFSSEIGFFPSSEVICVGGLVVPMWPLFFGLWMLPSGRPEVMLQRNDAATWCTASLRRVRANVTHGVNLMTRWRGLWRRNSVCVATWHAASLQRFFHTIYWDAGDCKWRHSSPLLAWWRRKLP